MARPRTYTIEKKNAMDEMAELWKEGHLTDIELVAEGKSVSAHRIILAGWSPYFRRMFVGDFIESKQNKVNIEGINYRTLATIIKCIYTKELTLLDTDSVSDVLAAADFFQVDIIMRYCELYMIDELSNETCFKHLGLLEKFNLVEGQEEANKYVLDNFMSLTKTQDFLTIEKDALCSYLDHKDFRISEEIEAFRAVRVWIEHDPQRLKHCEEIMQCIRLAFIPSSALVDEVSKACFMQQDKACVKLLSEAMEYHNNIYTQPVYKGTINRPRKSASLFIIEEVCQNQGANDNDFAWKENCGRIITLDKKDKAPKEFTVGVNLCSVNFNMIVFNGFVCVLGPDRTSSFMLNRRYDVNLDQWVFLAPMPSRTIVHGAGAARIGNTIIVAGGVGTLGPPTSHVASEEDFVTETFIYDTSTNHWRFGSTGPTPGPNLAMTSLDNLVYTAGARKIMAYNLNDDRWLTKPDPPQVAGAFLPMLNAIDDRLILSYHISYREPVAAMFDPRQNQWSTIILPAFTTEMHWKTSFVHNSEVYIFNTEGPLQRDKFIKIDSDGEHVVVQDYLPPYPGRMSCAVICAD